jgi:hypothetical protein
MPHKTAHTKTQSDSPLCTRTYTAYAVPDNVSNPLNPILRCPNPRGLFADFAAHNGITCRGRSSGSSPLFQTFPLQCNSGCKNLKLSYMRLTAAGQRLNCTAFPIKCGYGFWQRAHHEIGCKGTTFFLIMQEKMRFLSIESSKSPSYVFSFALKSVCQTMQRPLCKKQITRR